ncbi:MAG: FHA domain-containing protein [Candidatus Thiodiazotropha sp. (ex Notomyrtea botanica)]|nr:FHA domain-containing protein [Candidatus Thiodiazotropha sp. (ex Notomyrtea botanica)]
MEKLIVLTDDGPAEEFPLTDQRISIGRDETNAICLGDKSVSRHHASLQRVFRGFSLEDENSTNGTRVNSKPITKQFLNHGDLIEIGKYHLRYLAAEQMQEIDDPDRTVVLRPVHQSELQPKKTSQMKPASTPTPTPTPTPTIQAKKQNTEAKVRFLSGTQQGEEKIVDRAFFSVGQPGGDLVLINRRHTGYFLLKVGGENNPMINGNPIKAGGVELQSGDRIELGELSLEFVK